MEKNYNIKFDQVVDDSSQQATWYEQSIIDIIWIPDLVFFSEPCKDIDYKNFTSSDMDCDFSFNPK